MHACMHAYMTLEKPIAYSGCSNVLKKNTIETISTCCLSMAQSGSFMTPYLQHTH